MLTPLLRILATAILTLSIPAYADPVVMTPLSVAIQSQPDDRLAAFVDASLADVAVVLQNHAILTTSQSAQTLADPVVFFRCRIRCGQCPDLCIA